MKPTNTNPDLLLSDGAPVSCMFMFETDPPECWGRCETNATTILVTGERIRWNQWRDEHPKSPILLYPESGNGSTYLCDTHVNIIRECL